MCRERFSTSSWGEVCGSRDLRIAGAISALLAAAILLACGYHPVYAGPDAERFHVVLLRSLVADAVASREVLSGLRETLAKEGALAGGDGYPRVEVEILRADETSEGIAAPSDAGAGASANGGPRARGTLVGLVARAHLVRSSGGPEERDTGDMRAMDLVGSDVTLGVPDPRTDYFHHEDALRALAHRLGERLGLRVLGIPTVSDEGVGRVP
jgi:hypothetical protein